MTGLATEFDLIRDKYRSCPDCGGKTDAEPVRLFGAWFAVVACACGWFIEIELDAREEASIRY